MKKFYKSSIAAIVVAFFVFALIGLMGSNTAYAATTVGLGTADGFAVLAGSGITNSVGPTTITGDVGTFPTLTETGFASVTITGTNHVGDATTQGAKTDLVTAYNNAGQVQTGTISADLGGQTLTPGVYKDNGAPASLSITGTLTLDGQNNPNAVFIFQSASTLITASASHVSLINGAQACNVFWQIGSSVTLGIGSDFKGNILAMDSITDNGGSTIDGRFLARNAHVTLNNTTIAKAVCAAAPHLIVIKHVINDNAGISVAGDFSTTITGVTTAVPTATGAEAPGVDNVLTSIGAYSVDEGAHVGYTKTLSADCSGTIAVGETKTCTITNDDIPAIPPVAPQLIVNKIVVGGSRAIADFPLSIDGVVVTHGVANTTTVGAHTVSETSFSNYSASVWGGDCAANGTITLAAGELKTCTITNTFIPSTGGSFSPVVPPLIDVVKVPSPLSLPAGPGSVNYSYTLRNIGTVPVSNITMVGDTCSPITLTSGDINSDARLDVAETWVYNCSTTLSATHTNTVTATGWANGISATDIASATVVVGLPIVPPLIHITKVPNPLSLGAGGGMVTYTKRVTNPGTVPLNNVTVTDDKCSPITYISGDTNGDAKLDSSETWTYTCQTNLTQTTTNTARAAGTANGLTARDFAIATVTVAGVVTYAVPALPNTGVAPAGNILIWMIVFAGIFVALLTVYLVRRKQQLE